MALNITILTSAEIAELQDCFDKVYDFVQDESANIDSDYSDVVLKKTKRIATILRLEVNNDER